MRIKKVLDPKVKYIRNTPALKQLKAITKVKKQFNKYCNVFIGKKLTKEDKELIFSASLDFEDTITLHYKNPKATYSQIFRDLGIAKSTSEAKGAGWDKEVKMGFELIQLDGLKKYDSKKYKHPNPKRPHFIAILKR